MSRRPALVVLGLCVTAACRRETPGGVPLAESVTRIELNGSQALLPLLLEAANQYMRGNPGTVVSVSGDGSPDAVRDVRAGSLQIAAADLPEPGELTGLVDRPLAVVAIAIVANRGPWSEKLRSISRAQLRDIVTGRITNWSALGGVDQPLVFFDRSCPSGERAALARWLGTDAFMASAPSEPTAYGVQAALLARPGAISYLPLPYRHPELVTLAVDGSEPESATGPSPRYPIATVEHLYFRRDASAAVGGFVSFVSSESFATNLVALGYEPTDRSAP